MDTVINEYNEKTTLPVNFAHYNMKFSNVNMRYWKKKKIDIIQTLLENKCEKHNTYIYVPIY